VTGVPARAKPGTFVRVRITGGRGYDLTAAATADDAEGLIDFEILRFAIRQSAVRLG